MSQTALKSKLRSKAINPKWEGLKHYAAGSAFLSSLIVLLILGTLLIQSGPALFTNNLNLFSTAWDPAEGQYGIIPMIFGTLIVMSIAMIIALPLGVLSAIYIAETRSDRLRRILKSSLEVLAGIPSIVYGLIGVAYLSIWVAEGFELQTGRVILTAGLLLALMILPTIITLSEDAISSVPRQYRENAASLGLYHYEIIKDIVLPVAKADISGAALLALGRALGETMAVMLVIGSLDRLPSPLFNVLSSSQTITSKLGREIAESAFGSTHFSVLVLMSLILVIFTLILTIAAQKLFNKAPYRA